MKITIVSSKLKENDREHIQNEVNELLEKGYNNFAIAEVLANKHSCAVSTKIINNSTIMSLHQSLC